MLTVLIGPPASGKSTVGRLVAAATSRPFVDADERGGPWYAEVGWSVRRLHERAGAVGFERAHREWEVALAAAVVGLVRSHPTAVLALGAGHTHVTAPAHFRTIAGALSRAEQVVLLRPDSGLEAARQALGDRCRRSKGHDWQIDGIDWLRRWLSDGQDEQLATDVVLTSGESPQETARRIAGLPVHRRTRS